MSYWPTPNNGTGMDVGMGAGNPGMPAYPVSTFPEQPPVTQYGMNPNQPVMYGYNTEMKSHEGDQVGKQKRKTAIQEAILGRPSSLSEVVEIEDWSNQIPHICPKSARGRVLLLQAFPLTYRIKSTLRATPEMVSQEIVSPDGYIMKSYTEDVACCNVCFKIFIPEQ